MLLTRKHQKSQNQILIKALMKNLSNYYTLEFRF